MSSKGKFGIFSFLGAAAACASIFTLNQISILKTCSSLNRQHQDENVPMTASEKFKRKIIGNYENRIRFYAHPLKTFQYFASIKHSPTEFQMTSSDFVRSLIPFNESLLETQTIDDDYTSTKIETSEKYDDYDGLEHAGSQVLRNSYLRISRLADTNGDGLISFEEYLTMLSLLSMKHALFEISFKIFDVDGNGNLEYEEFARVFDSRENPANSRMGSQQRLKVSQMKQLDGILSVLFGPDGKKSCSFEEFSSVLSELRTELLKCEFYRFKSIRSFTNTPSEAHEHDTISAFDFGVSILSYVNNSHSLIRKRLEEKYKESPVRMSFQQFQLFDRMTENLDKLELGMNIVAGVQNKFSQGKGLTREQLRKVVHVTTGLSIETDVVDLIFCMFDENGDGTLDSLEFMGVVHSRDNLSLNRINDGILGKLNKVYQILFG